MQRLPDLLNAIKPYVIGWIREGTATVVPYGSLWKDDVATAVTLAVANTYYPITGGMTAGMVKGAAFVFQNASELRCSLAGDYDAVWSMTVRHSSSDRTAEGVVMVNSTQQPQTANATRTKENGVDYSLGGCGPVRLAVGDLVRLAVSDEGGTGTITVNHANLRLSRIG